MSSSSQSFDWCGSCLQNSRCVAIRTRETRPATPCERFDWLPASDEFCFSQPPLKSLEDARHS
jgi:hypothetical protein